jgi:hypothetical protein
MDEIVRWYRAGAHAEMYITLAFVFVFRVYGIREGRIKRGRQDGVVPLDRRGSEGV